MEWSRRQLRHVETNAWSRGSEVDFELMSGLKSGHHPSTWTLRFELVLL